MSEKRAQKERLDYLVEAFKEDSGEYINLQTPGGTNGKRRIPAVPDEHSYAAKDDPGCA